MARFILIFIFIFSLLNGEEVLRVGIKTSEPWVMYDKNVSEEKRKPIGFSIDLWNEIAKNIGVKTKWVYFDSTSALIDGAKDKNIDVGISAITITSAREKVIDFSNSMYELGLQVMVDAKNTDVNILELMSKEINKMMTPKSIFIFLLFLFITIHLRWYSDLKDKNSNLFDKNYKRGIVDAFWWGITMLVTWETPQTKGLSRIIDLMWHIVGIIAISILTAIVTSALTAQAIGGSIRSEKDLVGKYVGAVKSDAPRKYLEKLGANVVPVDSLDKGIELLRKGKIEALVHDGPRLIYLANKINKKEHKKVLMVLPFQFNPQNYGIIFPTGSELREKVDRVLLRLRESDGLDKSFHEKLKEKWLKTDN